MRRPLNALSNRRSVHAVGHCAFAANDSFVRSTAVGAARSEGLVSADSVEKQRVAGAESRV